MFGAGQRLHRPRVLLPERRARHLRDDRRRVPGVLPVPVRLRRHLLDDHLGRHGRPHRLRGRPALQHRRERLHLPDLRPLGLGSRTAGSPRMDTPFRDFAGSTVVHTVGGMIALTGAIALGPRLGRKFKRDGGGMPPGHDMTIAAIGGVILWFGWYGFNPGARCRRSTPGASAGWPPTPRWPPRAGGLVAHVLRLPPAARSGTPASPSTASSPASSPSRPRATG